MTTTLTDNQLTVPDAGTADQAARAVDELGRFLRSHPELREASVSLDTNGSVTTLRLPSTALHLLVQVLGSIANGDAVAVTSVRPELTTQQAADLLNVSRPYFVKLLEDGRLPFRRVGNRRRVLLTDLMEYKRTDDSYRRAMADALTEEAQHLGLDD